MNFVKKKGFWIFLFFGVTTTTPLELGWGLLNAGSKIPCFTLKKKHDEYQKVDDLSFLRN